MRTRLLLLCAIGVCLASVGCSSKSPQQARTVTGATSVGGSPPSQPDSPIKDQVASGTTIPAELMTPALSLFGAPFDKPLHYKVTGPDGEKTASRTVTVESVEGGKVRLRAEWSGGLPAAGPEVYESTKEGIVGISIGSSDVNPPSRVLPANPRAGDTWPVKYSTSLAGSSLTFDSRAKVVGREKVSVPLGEFDALLVEESGTVKGSRVDWRQTTKTWFVEGIGMVKAVISYKGKTDQNIVDVTQAMVAVKPPNQ